MDRTKSEVLRYLGRRGHSVPEDISAMVDECISLMRSTVIPRHVSMRFEISAHEDGVWLENAQLLLTGRDIAQHLHGCSHVVLTAATLGAPADSLIRRWERTDLTRSLILDACATQLIEQYCDEIEHELIREAATDRLTATHRFSPGYGDLPLDIQPQLLAVLNAGRRIGLTHSESFMLIPSKSVTALTGLGENLNIKPSGCDVCTMSQTCSFRKDGTTDGCARVAKG